MPPLKPRDRSSPLKRMVALEAHRPTVIMAPVLHQKPLPHWRVQVQLRWRDASGAERHREVSVLPSERASVALLRALEFIAIAPDHPPKRARVGIKGGVNKRKPHTPKQLFDAPATESTTDTTATP
jgi:hypothetical protein